MPTYAVLVCYRDPDEKSESFFCGTVAASSIYDALTQELDNQNPALGGEIVRVEIADWIGAARCDGPNGEYLVFFDTDQLTQEDAESWLTSVGPILQPKAKSLTLAYAYGIKEDPDIPYRHVKTWDVIDGKCVLVWTSPP